MKNFMLILVPVLFLACSGKEKNRYPYTHSLALADSVSIGLDASTSFEFQNVRYFANDTLSWLIALNPHINGLNIYDLNAAELISQFSVPTSGPFSISSLNGMTFVNPDSIFLYSTYDLRRILLVDYNGNPVNTIRLDSTELKYAEHRSINHQSNTSSPTIFANNKLYFTLWPIFDFSRPENISDKVDLEVVVDLNTLTMDTRPVAYPKWMQNKGWITTFALNGKAYNGKDFVYNFQGDDSITVEKTDGSMERYYAGLSSSPTAIEPISRRLSPAKEVEAVMTHALYWNLMHDQYRDVYYRIADNPITYMSDHKTLMAVYDKPLSVIILDANFTKVGEFDLSPDTYLLYGAFVGKRGLYIPRIHPKYQGFSEDKITYSIYELTRQNEAE